MTAFIGGGEREKKDMHLRKIGIFSPELACVLPSAWSPELPNARQVAPSPVLGPCSEVIFWGGLPNHHFYFLLFFIFFSIINYHFFLIVIFY